MDSDPMTMSEISMEVDVVLCDHAEAADGKLFVNGGGVNVVWTQAEPPYMVNLYVAGVVQVPYTATNQAHNLTVSLHDADGRLMRPWLPPGTPDEPPPVEITMPFNLGRPPLLPAGETQTHPFAFGFQLPLSDLAAYSFLVQIDGVEARRLPFRLLVPPSGPQAQLGPPTPTSF